MFKGITCPTCSHKWRVPESTMGKRINCENCQTPFVAGASVAASTPSQSQPGGFNQTMLGQQEAMINYKCPRCQKPLQSPAFEAGKKKPCPECGQRLLVPQAPARRSGIDKTMLGEAEGPPDGRNKTMLTDAEPPQHGTNKTMLVGESPTPPTPPIRYNCPRCRNVIESQAHEAGTKKNCPSCGQRHKVPETSTLPSQGGAYDSGQPSIQKPKNFWDEHFAGRPIKLAAVIIGTLLLLFFVVPAIIRGGKIEDTAAKLKAEQELAKLKADIAEKQRMYELKAQYEAKQKAELAKLQADFLEQQKALERRMEQHRRSQQWKEDEEYRRKKKLEREKAELELKKEMQAMRLKLEQQQADAARTKRELEEQIQARQKQTTVVQQAPVVQYVPPYDWRYYRPYPWWY